ncbi:type I-MYXAN CRISPR-associated protein Cas6/Cmx6 [Ectothiorhodospiraceae bacterium 2226]|nr:type I-MYXAN CRISPR-associated protein Cas6/Cmx6 [Ectothiorhodospiraceae bacterium 2226]
MLWQDEIEEDGAPAYAPDVVDLVFRIECRTLPVDHAHALSRAVLTALPWLDKEPRAGIHTVHPAASGNGWYRPEDPGEGLLHLSRRTPLMLRLPRERIEAARTLCGRVLDIDGHPMAVGEAHERRLAAQPTLFARAVLHPPAMAELALVESVAEQLHRMGIAPRKILCGRRHRLRTPAQDLHACSVLVADLQPADAIELQRQGIGEGRRLGCGLFIGHKGVAPVKRPDD